MTNFHIITLFPESFSSYFSSSILKRAQKNGVVRFFFYNPRDFSKEKSGGVDGKPYGGGPGMVIQAPPTIEAIKKAVGRKKNVEIIFFTPESPKSKKLDNKMARELAEKKKHIVLICGHYEGIDARVKEVFSPTEVSIGDYVLTGGELPAMVLVDTVSRFIPGVLGNALSLEEDRVSSPDVYTRPEKFKYGGKAYSVPEVLLSGHHQKIDEWRQSRRAKTND